MKIYSYFDPSSHHTISVTRGAELSHNYFNWAIRIAKPNDRFVLAITLEGKLINSFKMTLKRLVEAALSPSQERMIHVISTIKPGMELSILYSVNTHVKLYRDATDDSISVKLPTVEILNLIRLIEEKEE